MSAPLIATVIGSHRAILGEGPLWDHRHGCLWRIDILGKALIRHQPDSGEDRVIPLPSEPGMIALRPGGGLLAALRSGLADITADGVVTVRPNTAAPIGQRYNDGASDPWGRLWVGTVTDDEVAAIGALHRHRDGRLHPVRHGLIIPNGIAWSADRRTLYHIDSPTRQVVAIPYDHERDALGEPRVALTFNDGYPDGMAIDAEGLLWVALWNGGKVARCDPATGRRIGEVLVPGVAQVSSCAFGGPDLRRLYITTARKHLDAVEQARQPLAGRLFTCDVPVAGLPAVECRS